MIAKEYLPPDILETELRSLMKLVSEIEAAPSGSADACSLIEQFNTSTGKEYPERDFREYYGAVTLETFVKEAMITHPRKFHDVPDAQFLAILGRLRDTDCDEAEQSYWIQFLEMNLDCDHISDLIYWSDDDPSDSEVLARAKGQKRSAIILP